MSQGKGLVAKLLHNFFSSLKPRDVSGKLIGKDYLGNTYFEIKSGIQVAKKRPSRYYIPKDNDTTKFDEPLPAEWEAWLRLRRKEPPSEEEIEKNITLMNSKKANALEIEKKFKPQIDGNAEEEQVVTGIKNFPNYDEYEKFPGKGPRR